MHQTERSLTPCCRSSTGTGRISRRRAHQQGCEVGSEDWYPRQATMVDERRPEGSGAAESGSPSDSLLSEQARWVVVFVLGTGLIAAIIADWRFVLLVPVMVIWFSLPYMFAVEPPKDERAKVAPHHDERV
jgi:hypothetical protein